MKYARLIALAILYVWMTTDAAGQHWQKVVTLPSLGSAASFINADVGCVGTGDYNRGAVAEIWYTRDGGTTWTRSLLPNPHIYGQITDIYFRDALNGWATIQETIEHGWSGVYRTVDGGLSWNLWYQAVFPVSIRETAKGVFFTDRYSGIRKSVDGGNSFTLTLASAGALGLDFMNDNVGLLSTEGDVTQPYYSTVDGGLNWLPYPAKREAWGTFADPATRRLFFSSEHDVPYPGSQSFVGVSTDFGVDFQQSIVTDTTDGFTGGIAGNRGCRSVVYIQRQRALRGNTKLDDGMMRSTDGGVSWVAVGGPYNFNDKRFAVTGRGAVVYAFDRFGGIWKTTDGGDGRLGASIFPAFRLISIGPTGTLKAAMCDSASISFTFNYADCDSVAISQVLFPDDTAQELQARHKPKFFGYGGSSADTVTIWYKPAVVGTETRTIQFVVRQSDGFLQDTSIQVQIQGIAAPEKFSVAEVKNDSLGFGIQSICTGDSVRLFTIGNSGCSSIDVKSIVVTGNGFTLWSGFSPITLDPGVTKQYLVRYKPTTTGPETGALVITTGTQTDSIVLRGTGKSGGRALAFVQSAVSSTICDSAVGIIRIRNLSCSAIRMDSLSLQPPFYLDPTALPVSIPTDSVIILHYRFVPRTPGVQSQPLVLHCFDVNQRFDTTLTVTGTASEGVASMTYSPDHFDFGQVSICSSREFTVSVVSTGCDTLDVPTDLLIGDTSAFHIVSDIQSRHVRNSDTITLTVHFHPFGTVTYGSTLHIVTNAGAIDIPMTGSGSSDPGTLTLSAATLGTVLTCKDTTFSVKLENTTCDSLTFDSTTVTGMGANDFTVTSGAPAPLDIGRSVVINGGFVPLAGGSRDAVLHCYLHRSDGTVLEITSPLHGTGIRPSPVRIDLAAGAVSAPANGEVLLPITVLDTSYIDVRTVELVLRLNTDLLSPTAFDPSGSVLSGLNINSFDSGGDTVRVLLDVPPGERLHAGLLGTVRCSTFVTDTIESAVAITRFDIFDATHSNGCLQTTLPSQSQTSFTLLPACGTSTLSTYLREGDAMHIEAIVPNPTHSEITLRARIGTTLSDDLTIELIDDAGNVVQREKIAARDVPKSLEHKMIVAGASGARTLRMHSGAYQAESRFLLVR